MTYDKKAGKRGNLQSLRKGSKKGHEERYVNVIDVLKLYHQFEIAKYKGFIKFHEMKLKEIEKGGNQNEEM